MMWLTCYIVLGRLSRKVRKTSKGSPSSRFEVEVAGLSGSEWKGGLREGKQCHGRGRKVEEGLHDSCRASVKAAISGPNYITTMEPQVQRAGPESKGE